MTASSCRAVIVLIMGALSLTAGCATVADKTEIRPRMTWGSMEEVEENRIQMGWAGDEQTVTGAQVYWAGPIIALLPVHNLTASPAPLDELYGRFREELVKSGVEVLKENTLQTFMSANRTRYTGGLDEITASLIKYETGVEAVFISNLEYFDDQDPPKIALHARLVTAGDKPEILWMDSACMTGLDSPGLLDVGVIEDPGTLLELAARRLVSSMVLELAGQQADPGDEPDSKASRPNIEYRSPVLDPEGLFTIAVIPFLNLSERPRAGEILPLHFAQLLSRENNFKAMEPGVVRRGLLQTRVTLEGGLSKPYLELILRSTDADLVLTGTVFQYLDSTGPVGEPDVEFSVQVYDRGSKEIAWSSRSTGRGDDGLVLFDVGKRRTACELAAGLVSSTLARVTEKADSEMSDTSEERMAP